MKGRSLLAVAIGILIAFGTIFLVEELGHRIYPPSQAILDAQKQLEQAQDPQSQQIAREALKDAIRDYLADAPTGASLMVMFAWFLGTFLGSLSTSGIAREKRLLFGLIVGGLVFLATIANIYTIPYHPTWMIILSLALIPELAYLGAKLGIRLFPIDTTES